MSNSDEPLKKHYKYETVDGDAVIRDELDRLVRRRSRAVDEELLPETAPTDAEEVSESLTGLALSGGGIRSGALGLGILQTLHRTGLLPFFDYLSTVSGGGYAAAYVTSAGSQNRKHADENSARSTSHDDTVPYGRLKAFHDAEGLSERMQEFIFGGHYLLRTRRFFNRHLMGLLSIWFMTVTGLSTIAVLAAYLFRELDQPVVRHFLGGLGFRTDLSRGFFPVTALLVLWCLCWTISFFRASGNMARAQGRAAAKLIPVIAVTFGICVASLLGNGEFSLEWISSPNGIDVAGLFSSAEKFFQFALYGVIGLGLLPFLNPAALIRSGARPKSARDRFIFAVASRVLLYGLPFLLVSWFAREDISSWTDHRFVPDAIRDAGLRGSDQHELAQDAGSQNQAQKGAAAKNGTAEQAGSGQQVAGDSRSEKDELSGSKHDISEPGALRPNIRKSNPEHWTDFVALTRHEISGWNDWQPAWAPFWTKLRATAETDRIARGEPVTSAVRKVQAAEADFSRKQKSSNDPRTAADAARVAAEEAAKAFANAQNTVSASASSSDGPEQGGKDEANSTAKKYVDSVKTQQNDDVENARLERSAKRSASERAEAATETAKLAAQAAKEALDAAKAESSAADAADSKRRPSVAEYLWDKLNDSLRAHSALETLIKQHSLVDRVPEGSTPRVRVGSCPVEDFLRQIHMDSLALQELYAFSELNTDSYAPDSPRLIFNRLLSLVSYAPDYLRGAKDQNHVGEFVVRRQRLALLRNTLADHLSRILETTNLGEECDWSDSSVAVALLPLVEQARQMSGRHGASGIDEGQEENQSDGVASLSNAERRQLARLNRKILDATFPETLRDPSTVFAANVLEFDQARR